jgi:hypothetical protein
MVIPGYGGSNTQLLLFEEGGKTMVVDAPGNQGTSVTSSYDFFYQLFGKPFFFMASDIAWYHDGDDHLGTDIDPVFVQNARAALTAAGWDFWSRLD